MAHLTRDEAHAILQKVLRFSKADGCEAFLTATESGNIRFARNTVTTSGATSNRTLRVQSNFGKRSGTATVNEFDDASLEKVVRRAEELARLSPENPEFVEVLGPQQYRETKAYFESTAAIDPEFRASAVAASLEPARARELTAAGFLQDERSFSALMNSRGLFAYYPATRMNFSVTVRTNDGTGSGYAVRDANDASRLDAAAAAHTAIDKALRSRTPRAVEPGKYTVILEPAASIGLLQLMFLGMNARLADEGRSFLSKPGGGTRVGEKLVDARVTFVSDPANSQAPFSPWSDDGRPQQRTAWIENGVVKNLYYTRFWAEKKGVQAIPFPGGGEGDAGLAVLMSGGEASLEDLIRDTQKGILVTRTWYIRMVDPQTMLLTGLTRDGTFWIEDGQLAHPIKNFRFNESPVLMLDNLEALGKPERIGGSLIPPMKIRNFTFSSLSEAV